MNFNLRTKSLEKCLVKLRNLTMKVYPKPKDQPVTAVDGTVLSEQYRFDRVTSESGKE